MASSLCGRPVLVNGQRSEMEVAFCGRAARGKIRAKNKMRNRAGVSFRAQLRLAHYLLCNYCNFNKQRHSNLALHMKSKVIYICSLLIFVGSAPAVFSTNFYVSPAVSDLSSGTQSQPWKTIQKGLNSVQAGDKLTLVGGSYPAAGTTVRPGTNSARITIVGEGTPLSQGKVQL